MKWIIKAKDYFFIHKNIPNNINVNKELLFINYKDILPYKEIKYIKKGENLYIYGTDKKKIAIPEGYLLFKSINKDGIYFSKNNNYYNILIIKDKTLIKDFFLEDISLIPFLEFEHNLKSYEINYNKSIKKGLKNSLIDLIKLSGLLDINKKNLEKEISIVLNIAIIAIVIITIILFLYNYNLNKKINSYENKLLELRTNLKKLDNKIHYINQIYNKFSKIKTKNTIINLYNQIAAAIPKNNRLSYINNYNKKIIFTIDGNNSLNILKNLNKIKNLQKIKLISTINLNKNIKRFKFESEYNK